MPSRAESLNAGSEQEHPTEGRMQGAKAGKATDMKSKACWTLASTSALLVAIVSGDHVSLPVALEELER